MKHSKTISSIVLLMICNILYGQDIINDIGSDGKFIVRDAAQDTALIIKKGSVEILGELSVEQMSEGNSSNPYVVWDPTDKKFKTVNRIFSKVSPLSEQLETGIGHSIIRGNPLDEDGNEISANVQGIAEVLWNQFDTDYGYIKLGPASPYAAHIYSEQKFIFNKEIRSLVGKIGSHTTDLYLATKGTTRMTIDKDNGNVGIGTVSPDEKLHIAGNMRLDGTFEDEDGDAGTNGQILSATNTGTNWIAAGGGAADNLGDHTATDTLNMAGFEVNLNGGYLSGDGDEEGIYVDNDGNVGIGTDSPTQMLDVADTIRTTGGIEFSDGTVQTTAGGGSSSLWIESGNDVYRSSGNVGIGTTNPQEILDINGTLKAKQYITSLTTLSENSGTINWNMENSNIAYVLINNDVTVNLTNADNVGTYILIVEQVYGGNTIIFDSIVQLRSAERIVPTLTPYNAGDSYVIDIFTFVSSGNKLFCVSANNQLVF